jgi:hypothetical protein
MKYQRNRIILVVCVIGIVLTAASIIKSLSSKSSQPEKGTPLQEKAAPQQDTMPAPGMQGTVKKTIPAPATVPRHGDRAVKHGPAEEIVGEGAEREDEEKEEDPEKIDKKASLEKQIQALTQEKEQGQKELDKLLAATGDAQSKSQLSAEDKKGKEYEVMLLKLYMVRMFQDKLKSIDDSLQEKLKEYKALAPVPSPAPDAEDYNNYD